MRDALVGRTPADIDVATDARPPEVMALAAAAGLKVVPTGVEHGTVTVVCRGDPIEVTTFRRDVETDGRRAVVAFSDDIAEDAARRDFTMNALYARPDGTVVDPLGGLPDLLARRIRFVGDPAERIAEDALRILRFFRFNAWFAAPGAAPDAAGLAACAAGAGLVARLSAERVAAEIARLLGAPDPAPAAVAMAAAGVLERVLPGADPAGLCAARRRRGGGGMAAGLAPPARRARPGGGLGRAAPPVARRSPRPGGDGRGGGLGPAARGRRLRLRRRGDAGRRPHPRRADGRAAAAGPGSRDRPRRGGAAAAARRRPAAGGAGTRRRARPGGGGVAGLRPPPRRGGAPRGGPGLSARTSPHQPFARSLPELRRRRRIRTLREHGSLR